MIQKLLGLQVYLSRYNVVKEGQQPLRDHESFDDWSLTLPQLDEGALLCCPEASATGHVLRVCLCVCAHVHVCFRMYNEP